MVNSMKKSQLVRETTKRVITAKHVRNYRYNFAEPMTKTDEKIMPFVRDPITDKLELRKGGKPQLDNILDEQESLSWLQNLPIGKT